MVNNYSEVDARYREERSKSGPSKDYASFCWICGRMLFYNFRDNPKLLRTDIIPYCFTCEKERVLPDSRYSAANSEAAYRQLLKWAVDQALP